MSDCNDIYKKLIPLSRVVNAALLDTYADAGKSKELAFHWAARGFKKLNRETLKMGKRHVLLKVNHNTKTAALPADFDYETFVGVYASGIKIPMPINNNLINYQSIEDVQCDNSCPKCNQNTSICEELEVTETVDIVTINDVDYTKTVVKKLYPDGRYYLETTIPYYNTITEEVEYATTKEFITALDLKECGCLESTDDNIEKLKVFCPDVYACYYAPCASKYNTSLGGYKIFEENGYLQLDYNYQFDNVYVEYMGYMRKVNGQWAVPEFSFETLVNYTKFKGVENKSSVPLSERNWYFMQYDRERRNMEKVMGRISLRQIVNAILKVPKFDIDWENDCPTKCAPACTPQASRITSASVKCETTKQYGATVVINQGGDGECDCVEPFQIAVICNTGDGTPVIDSFDYQNDDLIGAVPPELIVVNNNNESRIAGDYSFNATTGTITRTNQWVDGDVLIVPFAKISS